VARLWRIDALQAVGARHFDRTLINQRGDGASDPPRRVSSGIHRDIDLDERDTAVGPCAPGFEHVKDSVLDLAQADRARVPGNRRRARHGANLESYL
jgi:hypothetical protein